MNNPVMIKTKLILKNDPLEDEIQATVFTWCKLHETKYPILKSIYAIPNGSHKSVSQRVKFQRTGLRPGMPDICLPAPIFSEKIGALYIELKRAKGKLSENQITMIEILKEQGNAVHVAYSFEEAIKIIEDFCKLYYGI